MKKIDVCFLILGVIIISTLGFFIVYKAGWALGDDILSLSTTAIGKTAPPSKYIMPQIGRFYPLGLIDYNVLLLFFPEGVSCTAHYILNLLCFLCISVLLVFLCKAITRKGTFQFAICILFSVMLLARSYFLFQHVFYPERLLFLMLPLFVFCGYRFWQTEKTWYGIGAFLSGLYATYCKEPIFGALLVFALVLLMFSKNLSLRKKIWLYSFVVNAIIFLVLYYFFVFCHMESSYASKFTDDRLVLLLKMIWSQKILIAAIPIILLRAIKFIKGERDYLFFDALLLAGIAYFGACIILRLPTGYFYLPSVFLIAPAMVYFLQLYLKDIWCVLLIGALATFYTFKTYGHIQSTYQARLESKVFVDKLSKYHYDGYEYVWQACACEDWLQNIYCNYSKTVYEINLQYQFRDTTFHFIEENEISRKYVIVAYNIDNPNFSDVFNVSLFVVDSVGIE